MSVEMTPELEALRQILRAEFDAGMEGLPDGAQDSFDELMFWIFAPNEDFCSALEDQLVQGYKS